VRYRAAFPAAADSPIRAHGFGHGDKGFSVVWWDPHVLELEKTPSFSLRQEHLLKLETGDVRIIEIAAGARPFGPRFGSLVHAVLATIPLDGNADQICASAQLRGRILGAPAEEIEAAITTVAAALQHPLMERARKAAACGACHREVPLTLREDDGTVIEGLADLAFRENGKWIVVDFKTDQELAAALERYRRQVAIYASAISNATSSSSEAFLFRL
jgi:ATP-dependent exoDNAse (exonuclease V) beta subunit